TENARVRTEGTRNLVKAALAAATRRLIAQSIAWVYASGALPQKETDPLDLEAQGTTAVTVSGVMALESAVLNSPPLEGVVLRYGQFYGPGTGHESPAGTSTWTPLPMRLCLLLITEPLAAFSTSRSRTSSSQRRRLGRSSAGTPSFACRLDPEAGSV